MEELERRIIKSVKPHLGKPLALSGGVDSSLLACLMKPKFAISVELPGGDKYNEIKWSRRVCEKLKIKQVIIKCDEDKFEEYVETAVKAIGRPIPHFNIFPLFCMYNKLYEMGERELVLGDGPDETMCGYARDLIINYLYKIYDFGSLTNYKGLVDKILPSKSDAIKLVTGLDGYTDMVSADIAMRRDMDDMSNGIARHFGIKNIRPYQDDIELDSYMRNLPVEAKIHGEYGKWALRTILAQYLPKVAYRKKKVGGPVYPVGKLIFKQEDEFSKDNWLLYQKNILKK